MMRTEAIHGYRWRVHDAACVTDLVVEAFDGRGATVRAWRGIGHGGSAGARLYDAGARMLVPGRRWIESRLILTALKVESERLGGFKWVLDAAGGLERVPRAARPSPAASLSPLC